MKNQHLQNLNKIEFVITFACTGRCKHCSEGDHTSCGERIDPVIAADAARKIAAEFGSKNLPGIYALIDKYKDGKSVVIFKSRKEADAFINGENL